ncbi:hypothetical protein D5272_13295 [bacterium D16-76]|nr:hypothetical protein [bacterium D16-76]
MDYMLRCTSKSTIEELVKSLSERQESLFSENHSLLMDTFQILCKSGVDYYDILALYSTLSHYTENDLQTFIAYAPRPSANLSFTKGDIRRAIPRWTASRYHSATIDNVLSEVQGKLLSGVPGMFCYNSNLNPKNRRSLNDLYVLIITDSVNYWFDINRKCTYKFMLGDKLYD